MRARRSSPHAAFAIPAVEAKGTLLLEDVGVPLPRLDDLVTGIAQIAADCDVMISVIAHAGDGNTHPLIVYDPRDSAMKERAEVAFGEIMEDGSELGAPSPDRLVDYHASDQHELPRPHGSSAGTGDTATRSAR